MPISYSMVVPIGSNDPVDGIVLGYADEEMDITGVFSFNLSLGWGDSAGGTASFTITELELDADLDTTELVIPFTIGDLEASAGHPQGTTGSIDIEVHIDLVYDTPGDTPEVTLDPVGDSVSSVDFDVPIYASLAGVDINQDPLATIGFAGDLFMVADGGRGTTAVSTSSANLGAYAPFIEPILSTIQENLESLRDEFLPRLAVSEDFNLEIPFLDASFADVLDLGAAFDLAVLKQLDFNAMETLQDFVAVVTASGLIPDGQAVTYNTISNTLTVPFEFDIDLASLSLRDLDSLGVVDLAFLEDEGLIQIGPYVDPDDLLDNGYADLAALAVAGVLGVSSVDDWEDPNVITIAEAGIIGPAALDALDLIGLGNMVDLDDLIDEGLVTFGELAEADIVTIGDIVANLGFMREADALASNIADLGVDLLGSASNLVDQALVSLQDLITHGFTTLEGLFTNGVLGLGDLGIDSLNIGELLAQTTLDLSDLIGEGLVEVTDFLSSTLVDVSDLLTAFVGTFDLQDLITEEFITAADFVSSTLINARTFVSSGVVTLTEVLDEDLATIDNFIDRILSADTLVTDGLASLFELNFNDLIEDVDDVSLHDLVNSGVVTLQELIDNATIGWGDLVLDFAMQLSDILESGITDITALVSNTLIGVSDLATDYLDNLGAFVQSELVSLSDLVSNSLIGLDDLGLDNLDIAELIESALPIDLDDLVGANLLGLTDVVAEEFLASQLAYLGDDLSSITSLVDIIDLNALLADINLPIELHHLIYFGIIDHNDVRPLGDVDADVLTAANVIDASLLERNSLPEVIEMGYLSVGDIIDLGELAREDLADLPIVDLDGFGFEQSVIEAIDADGYIVYGSPVDLADLLSETDLTMRDLLLSGLINELDLEEDLSTVDLDDIFIQGTVDAESLLDSDVLENAILDGDITQNAQGKDIVAISDLTDLSYISLADLVTSGLLVLSDFDFAGINVSENDLLASGLVSPNKLDNNDLVQDDSPDYVVLAEILALNLASLADLAAADIVTDAHLTPSSLLLNDILAADIVGQNALTHAGLATSGDLDIETLIATGLVSESDLVQSGLVDTTDFWEDSVVSLRQLVEAGLVTESHLADNTDVDYGILMESDVVCMAYILEHYVAYLYESDTDDDTEPDPRNSDLIPIEDLLLDTHSPFVEMVLHGLLRGDRFINKVYEQTDLEAITVLDVDSGEMVQLFEDGELDDIVYVGSVDVDTLLDSLLYDVTLVEYVEEEFVDLYDFDNFNLDVEPIETEYSVDLDDATYPANIPLYSLIALDLTDITLIDLIEDGFVDEDDLTDAENLELDIRALEYSILFEYGDLNNYISAHQVFLHDLIERVYIGDLVELGELDADDLIIRNSGTILELADIVDGDLLRRDNFEDIDITAASIDSAGLVSLANLNAFNLVDSDDNVSLHNLLSSGLTSLGLLVNAGLVDEADYAASTTGVTLDRIKRSDIFDANLVEHYGLKSGDEGEEVVTLTADSGDTLLDAGGSALASLTELARKEVVTPAHLAGGSSIDKDTLLDQDLADLSDLINGGLIAADDILPASRNIDLQALNDTGTLLFQEVSGLDVMIGLGLLTAEQVDGLSVLNADALVDAGLVTENDLVTNGLFGTHLELVALLKSGRVAIDDLEGASLDDRSGLVALDALLDAGSLTVTLANLQTDGLVSESVRIDALLESGLVSLLDLVEGGVDKAALLASGAVSVSEAQLISNNLFDPNVEILGLVESDLATVQNLVDEALISNTIDLEELILLNMLTGPQLVSAGIIDQSALDAENFEGSHLVDLVTTNVAFEDGTGPLVSLADLAAYGFFDSDVVRAELIATTFVDDTALNNNGFTGVDLLNPRLLIVSGLVTADDLAREGFIAASLNKDDIIAVVALGIDEADLVNAGLLMDMVDAQDLADAGLPGVTLGTLGAADLITEALITRTDLDDLPLVDYDVLDLVWLDIDRLLDSGLIGDNDEIDLDDLLDENIPALGEPLLDLADLVRKGLVRERHLDGHNSKLFSLDGYTLSFASDYGFSLSVKPAEFKPAEFTWAEFHLIVEGAFDLVVDFDGEVGEPSEGQLTMGLEDFELTTTVAYELIDLDVPARLGFIGVNLGNVHGADNLVQVDISRRVTIASATFEEMLAQDFAGYVVEAATGSATAVLTGITVNTGLGGLNVAHGAQIEFELEDLTRDRSNDDYITLTMHDVPAMFRVYEYLRLDDLMSTLLRGRDYVLEAFDELPFFITDPNSPIYDLLSEVTIPVINKTPAELLSFLGTINDAVDRVQRALLDPDNDLQMLVEFIMDKLDLDMEKLGEVIQPGTKLGPVMLPETGVNRIECVAVCGHDTACVVAAIPVENPNFAYISAGTWCIVGIESTRPLISQEALELGITNERGYGNSYRSLKNIVGLWLLQGLKRQLTADISFTRMEEMVRGDGEASQVIDPDDPGFYNPENMKEAFDRYFEKSGQQLPERFSDYIRCAYDSLCFSFRYHIEQLEKLSQKSIEVLHLVGGGSQSDYLCQRIASICEREVISGPVEGAAMGNVIIQGIAMGRIENLQAGRELVKQSCRVGRYRPGASLPGLEERYRKYLTLKT
ncbi:MAG: hypothetical protein KAS94_02165 [Desulfobulbaceae bacterium]|nr:hypothetical protein [Desulfobulbaceae bacterium]